MPAAMRHGSPTAVSTRCGDRAGRLVPPGARRARRAAVAVPPDRDAGFPMKLTYMAMGKAIVASAGSAKNLVDGITARVVPDGDHGAFADALRSCQDPAARERLGRRPRRGAGRRGLGRAGAHRVDSSASPDQERGANEPIMNRPRIAITMGDAAGIGPEITVRSLAIRASEWCVPFVIGDARASRRRWPSPGHRWRSVASAASPMRSGRLAPSTSSTTPPSIS